MVKRFLQILGLKLSGDWFTMKKNPRYQGTILGPARGMKIWGVYHSFRWHPWAYELTYDEALAQVNSLNNQILEGTLNEVELQRNYDEVVKRGMK